MAQGLRRREFLVESSRAAVGLAFLPGTARAQASQKSAESKSAPSILELERLVSKLMAEMGIPGASMAIIKDARLFWRKAFGVKDRASRQPVDNDTVFEAASISKTVFAYAAMKLCEKGVIGLDTPLTKYSPKPFLEGDPRLELITARHVLSHTSGFQNWRSDENPLKIHFTPGEKYMYSGEGYSYLQSVISHVTGQPIEQFMKANVFVPFGMTSSGYVWNELFEKRASRPHDAAGKPLNNKKRTASDVARYAAAGDLHTTPSDYAKFLMEVINPKPADDFRLSKASLSQMLRPHVKVDELRSWSLGWQIIHSGGRNFITHGGDNEGFHAFAAASVDARTGYIVMTNGDGGVALLNKLAPGELSWFL